jgi:hypothetical protein
MKDRIEETIMQLNTKVLGFITWITGAMSFIDIVDATSKVVLFIISAGAGVLAWQNYRLKNRKLKKEIEELDQREYARIEANKKARGYDSNHTSDN